ncbi:MAG: DUF2520 domain-containing protein [Bacteroidales bacterium]|nr:DUF2520 domain-containing protein [Bacteroidales bacterium]
MPDHIQSAVIIGTGNVAWHLGMALQSKKIRILQVLGRRADPAEELAGILKAGYTVDPGTILLNADIYIIAVTDDAIGEVVRKIPPGSQLVIHTAGSVPMSVFKEQFENYGVLYPLQTFTKGRDIHFEDVPLCIEANKQENLDRLIWLAELLSGKVFSVNSEQRATLHLSAVFACNFTNHMYSIAEQILNKHNLDYSILHSLIIETATKATCMKPREAQTGPALRNNRILMDKHIKMLEHNPPIKEIYQILSENIRKYLTDEL